MQMPAVEGIASTGLSLPTPSSIGVRPKQTSIPDRSEPFRWLSRECDERPAGCERAGELLTVLGTRHARSPSGHESSNAEIPRRGHEAVSR